GRPERRRSNAVISVASSCWLLKLPPMTTDPKDSAAHAPPRSKRSAAAATNSLTRRQFAKRSLAAWPALAGWSALGRMQAAESSDRKPNSKFAGVQIGLNVPYSFADPGMSGDDILKNCVQLGLSAVELRTHPVEAFLGVPSDLIQPKKTADAASAPERAEQLAKWRKSVSPERVKEFRKKYDDAGVQIE